MLIWVYVALGGALGALGRVGLAEAMSAAGARGLWATLAVNLAGCFAMGAMRALIDRHEWGSPALRALITGGFLGALTTFSTFIADGALLYREGRAWQGALYVLLSVLGGAACFALGWWLIERSEQAGAA